MDDSDDQDRIGLGQYDVTWNGDSYECTLWAVTDCDARAQAQFTFRIELPVAEVWVEEATPEAALRVFRERLADQETIDEPWIAMQRLWLCAYLPSVYDILRDSAQASISLHGERFEQSRRGAGRLLRDPGDRTVLVTADPPSGAPRRGTLWWEFRDDAEIRAVVETSAARMRVLADDLAEELRALFEQQQKVSR